MAYFKLYLLTPAVDNTHYGVSHFLKTIISEFYPQEKKINNSPSETITSQRNTFCFSFNEKISLHKNGQKDFSFSMIRKQWLGDSWITNPFINKIHNGTQLLLVDRYNNEVFFTVKNISYKLGKDNITYDFSCQDSFTYQTIRQNDGYSIDNNPDSSDFIGAKNIDWWVLNKIKPECHLDYTYIPLFQGLYVDNNNNLQLYTEKAQLQNVKKIIKPIYNEYITNDNNQEVLSEYYETFPFSLSGGNCSSALISLGSEIGLVLNFKEHEVKTNDKETNLFVKYFWYEPEKRDETSGLKYSPYSSIQSFGLTQSGDSLTTVLNVEANTINDEIVSLIPEAPLFFKNMFLSSEWENSSFKEGFFSEACRGKTLRSENSSGDFSYSYTVNDGGDNYVKNNCLYIKLKDNGKSKFKLPFFFPKVSFQIDEVVSYFYINETRYTPYSSMWQFVVRDGDNEVEYNDSYSPIPQEMFGKEVDAYIKVSLTNNEEINAISNPLIILSFTRDTTSEEEDFARIADICPWLENKLINFDYFLNQGIINKSEYNQLISTIQNDLRIVNGKLLLYSNQYYQAIKNKTKILSDITNNLDSLGATFNADVIDYYAKNGVVKDYAYFANAYDSIVSGYYKSNSNSELLDYESLLAEYFNNYFSAQQRFLKNMYNFREFFYSPVQFPNDTLYKHTLYLTNPIEEMTTEQRKNFTGEISYFSFFSTNYSLVNSNFDLYDKETLKPLVDIYDSSKTEIVDVVHKNNYLNYYIPLVKAGDIIPSLNYQNGKTYYRILYRTTEKKTDFIETTYGKLTFHHSDTTHNYYGFATSDHLAQTSLNLTNFGDFDDILDSKYEKVLHPVSFYEIVSEYLLRLSEDNQDSQLFYHNLDTNIQINNNWYTRAQLSAENSWIRKLSPSLWLSFISTEDEANKKWGSIFNEVENTSKTYSNEYYNEIVNFYIEKFPLSSIKYKGSKYIEKDFSISVGDNKFSMSYSRVNAREQTIIDYINEWKKYRKGEISSLIECPTSYTQLQELTLVTPSNEHNYYRRVVSSPWKGYFLGALSGVLSYGVSTLIGAGAAEASAISLGCLVSDSVWKNSSTCWATSGKNSKLCNGSALKITYTGYCDDRDISGKMDLLLNYATSEYAYDKFLKLQEVRRKNDFIGTIEEAKKISDSTKEAYKKDENGKIITDKNGNPVFNKNIILAQEGEYYLISKSNYQGENRKDVFDYYGLFGLTYSDAIGENNSNLLYNESFYRPIKLGNKVDKNKSYKMLIQKNHVSDNLFFQNDDDFNVLLKNSVDDSSLKRIHKTTGFPVTSNLVDIDFSSGGASNNKTLRELLANNGYMMLEQEDSKYWITATYDGGEVKFIVLQEEKFLRRRIIQDGYYNGDILKPHHRYSIYTGETIENINSGVSLDFSSIQNLTLGFFEVQDQASAFKQIKDLTDEEAKENPINWDETNSTTFYEKKNGEYSIIYTIQQMKALKKYYTLKSVIYSVENFSEKPELLSCPAYLHIEEYENGVLKSSSVELLDFDLPFSSFSEDNIFTKESISYKGKEIEYKYKKTTTELEKISQLTNGECWYKYNSRVDLPTLAQHALLIASELTMYWGQAYTASKYCEFFLPESWQPVNDGKTNFFADNVLRVVSESGRISLKLSNTFIPDVQKYSNGKTTQLPFYNISFTRDENKNEDTVLKKVNKNNIKNASVVLGGNKAYMQALQTLGEEIDNIYAEEYNISNSNIGKTTYYYSETGGIKWNEILSKLAIGSPNFNNFSGIYVMTYQILKKSFYPEKLIKYNESLNQHNLIWDSIYKNFPGVILENVFKNETATKPEDLYVLSKNAFKDMSEPEKGYTLSLIDVDNIKGYDGQELRIGDGILVDAEELYSETDDVQKAISQYLFITDISYDLRKDSDIALTVNSIKYQDKLIQRLAKLIK